MVTSPTIWGDAAGLLYAVRKEHVPMSNPRKPQVLDLVAVLHGRNDRNVEVGDVGTVVEVLPPDGTEVEFLDRAGKTPCVTTFRLEDVLVLNRRRTAVK